MNRYRFLMGFLLLSCSSPQAVSPQDLERFIADENNGLKQSSKANGCLIELMYKPSDLLIIQEAGGSEMTTTALNGLRTKYSHNVYFLLSFSKNEKESLHQVGSMEEYSNVLNKLSFEMPQFVSLTTSNADTIPVADFSFHRTFNVGRSTEVLFAFSRDNIKDTHWIQFNVNEFGLRTGNQRFRFSTDDLVDAPSIKFETIN